MRNTGILVVLLATACGGGGAPATCSWPAPYDVPDAATAYVCAAHRYYLACTNGQPGVTVSCPSADRDSCTADADEPGTTTGCTSRCHDDEYAIYCGAYSTMTTPPGCRFLFGSSEGGTIDCCPCGS